VKAYLITHLVLYVIAIATAKRERAPYSDAEMAITFFVTAGLIAWTIYMLTELT
jgi:hypothetical protein